MTGPQVPPPVRDQPVSLPQAVMALLGELPGLVSDRVQLLSLEMRRAREALVKIMVLGMLAAVMVATAWVALWLGVAATIVHLGLAWPWAWLIVLAINGGVAAWAALHAKSLLPLLGFPATLRRLTVAPAKQESTHSQDPSDDHRSHDIARQPAAS